MLMWDATVPLVNYKFQCDGGGWWPLESMKYAATPRKQVLQERLSSGMAMWHRGGITSSGSADKNDKGHREEEDGADDVREDVDGPIVEIASAGDAVCDGERRAAEA